MSAGEIAEAIQRAKDDFATWPAWMQKAAHFASAQPAPATQGAEMKPRYKLERASFLSDCKGCVFRKDIPKCNTVACTLKVGVGYRCYRFVEVKPKEENVLIPVERSKERSDDCAYPGCGCDPCCGGVDRCSG